MNPFRAARDSGVRLYSFHCGSDRAPKAICDPLDPSPGDLIATPYFFYAMSHPKGWVLFDTGISLRYLSDAGPWMGVELTPDDSVVAKLATIGVAPADVKVVVMSHLHFDHAGGLEHFPNADVVIGSAELEFARHPPIYQAEFYDQRDFEAVTRWRPVSGPYDVFSDGALVTLPTEGHTPGHTALRVRLRAGEAILAGDAAYLREKMRARRLPGILWNPDAIVESWVTLEAFERAGARLIFTHDLDYHTRPLAPNGWLD